MLIFKKLYLIDISFLRLKYFLIYNSLLQSKIVLDGPPEGGPSPYLNPTGGPSPATQSNKEDTIKIKTRQSRTQPYQFKAKNEWFVDRGIVECSYDRENFKWIPFGLRTDKTYPNSRRTFYRTMVNISENIVTSEFYNLV